VYPTANNTAAQSEKAHPVAVRASGRTRIAERKRARGRISRRKDSL
jgi:hypothetical protein